MAAGHVEVTADNVSVARVHLASAERYVIMPCCRHKRNHLESSVDSLA